MRSLVNHTIRKGDSCLKTLQLRQLIIIIGTLKPEIQGVLLVWRQNIHFWIIMKKMVLYEDEKIWKKIMRYFDGLFIFFS